MKAIIQSDSIRDDGESVREKIGVCNIRQMIVLEMLARTGMMEM